MDTKTIVKYASYVVGAVTLYSLLSVATVQVVILAVCAVTNIFYVNRN